jgi:hypothetical protein
VAPKERAFGAPGNLPIQTVAFLARSFVLSVSHREEQDMATPDELTQLDLEVQRAEQQAMRNLAEYLRDAVLEMPSESKLARAFVRHASNFESRAGAGTMVLGNLERDLEQDERGEAAEHLRAALACLSPTDRLYRSLETFSDIFDSSV